MLALIYILLGVLLGWQITGVFMNEKLNIGEQINLIWIRLVSSFGIGIMLETWLVYITAWALSTHTNAESPLGSAEACAMAACCAVILLTLIRPIMRKIRDESVASDDTAAGEEQAAAPAKAEDVAREDMRTSLLRTMTDAGLIKDMTLFKKEAVLYFVLLIFVGFTFNYVLHSDGDTLYMGYTVFSDYAPNLSLIRSFSWFENFPTQYPFFAGEDIKYHFMFMFLCGNLERMGLPICIAYNLPSVLGLFGFLVMLAQFARRVTGRFAAELIAPVLFVFRSGLALFYYIEEHLRAGDLIDAFRENTVFIGYTPNENWGLWNYNVYLNQRHLGFGLLVSMAVIWFYYGYLAEACEKGCSATPDQSGQTGSADALRKQSLFTDLFLCRSAWDVREPFAVILTGLILGMLSFWNGACVIGTLLVLAGFALFSQHKLDFLGLAVLTVSLSFMQTNFFIRGSAVSPTLLWGFISESKTPLGVLWFLIEISGMTIVGSLFAAVALERKYKELVCAFLLPVIFSFTISLTPDVTVNHKYIMMSMAFLSVIWAEMLMRLLEGKAAEAETVPESQGIETAPENQGTEMEEGSQEKKTVPDGKGAEVLLHPKNGWGEIARKVFAVLLAVVLTATGIYDFVIIMRDNGKDHEFSVDTESGLGHYLRDNLTWEDMVLSGPDSVSEFTVSGCRMYTGWPYYAWSAGYDTDYRFEKAKVIYSIDNEKDLLQVLDEEDITFVLFESGLYYDGVTAREDVIARALTLVYESEDKKYRLYQVP